MNTDLLAALSFTCPPLILLALAYVLRPQFGRLRPNPRPAREVVSRLEAEREAAPWTPHRPPAWTVQTRIRFADAQHRAVSA